MGAAPLLPLLLPMAAAAPIGTAELQAAIARAFNAHPPTNSRTLAECATLVAEHLIAEHNLGALLLKPKAARPEMPTEEMEALRALPRGPRFQQFVKLKENNIQLKERLETHGIAASPPPVPSRRRKPGKLDQRRKSSAQTQAMLDMIS